MKKLYNISLIFCAIFFTILFSFIIWYLKNNLVLAENIEDIKNKFIPSPVIAKINQDCDIFLDMELKNFIKKIQKGSEVEILEDRGTIIYFIKSNEHKIKGWVKKDFLDIPETPKSNKDQLKSKEIEIFINDMGLSSKTDYLVFTDIYRQLTYILKGKYEDWNLIKTFPCSTGLNVSPTTRGIFEIKERGDWFYSERFNSGAMYWVRFNGSYLFHSITMDKDKNIKDNIIGERRSSGCVRMNLDDIKWFYDNIPKGTTVFIN